MLNQEGIGSTIEFSLTSEHLVIKECWLSRGGLSGAAAESFNTIDSGRGHKKTGL